MDIQKISNEIATLKRAVKTAATVSLKDKLKKKIASLNEVLKDANIPAKKLAMMLLGAKRKVAGYTTAEFNAVIKRLSYKAEYTFLKGLTKVEIKDDLERHAKNPGWRFKGKGNFKTPTKSDLINDMGKPTSKRKTYYESRSNRSDVTHPAKLAKGGGVGDDQLNVVFSRQDVFERAKDFYENESAFYPSDVIEEFKTFVFDIENGEADVTEYYLDQELQGTDLDGYYFEIADKMAKGGGIENEPTAEDFKKMAFKYDDEVQKMTAAYIKFSELGDTKNAEISKYLGNVAYKNSEKAREMWKDAINNKMAKGGGVEEENKEMVLNNTQQIEHHAEELENAAKKSKHVPAWVVAKVYNASSNISDATHYLEGVNTMPKEQFERIHEEIESYKMADGGGLNSFMDKQMHISKVCKTHGCSSKDYLNAKKKYGIGGTLLLTGLGVAGLIAYNNSKNPITEDEYKLKMYKKGTLQNTIIVDESYVNKATEDYKKLGYIVRVSKVKKMATGGPTKAQEKVGKVMHEFKEGTLHSGKSGKVVKNPKQAIAIALSEAGLSKKIEGGEVKPNFEISKIKEIVDKNINLNNYKIQREDDKALLLANKYKDISIDFRLDIIQDMIWFGGFSKIEISSISLADPLLRYQNTSARRVVHKKINVRKAVSSYSALEKLLKNFLTKVGELDKKEEGGLLTKEKFSEWLKSRTNKAFSDKAVYDIYERNNERYFSNRGQVFGYDNQGKINQIYALHLKDSEKVGEFKFGVKDKKENGGKLKGWKYKK